MRTIDIIEEIKRLPITKQFYVVEETIKSIKSSEVKNNMEIAAITLYDDYLNDKEIMAFTALDFENFFEAK